MNVVSFEIQSIAIIEDSLLILPQTRNKKDVDDRLADRLQKRVNKILNQIPDVQTFQVKCENNR